MSETSSRAVAAAMSRDAKIQVYELIKSGLSYKQVAEALGVNLQTIEHARDWFWRYEQRRCVHCGTEWQTRVHITHTKYYKACHKCAAAKWHRLVMEQWKREAQHVW